MPASLDGVARWASIPRRPSAVVGCWGRGKRKSLSLGVSLFLALHNLWVWAGRRTEWRYLWVGLWCANSFFYQWSRYSQLTAETTTDLFHADRLAFTSAVLVIVAILIMARLIAVPVRSRLFYPVVIGAGLIVLGIHWTGELFITHEVATFTDWFGNTIRYAAVGPLYLPFLVLCSAAMHVYGVSIFWRAPNLDPKERWGFLFGITVYLGFGLNDVLLYSGFFETTSLFEYGFAAVAVSLNVLVVHYLHLVRDGLHEAVEKRTRELTAALEGAQAASRAKDSFLANISHELRTPLNGVIVSLEVLTDEEENPARIDLLRLARNSADSLLGLIDEILQIARLDTDTFHVREVDFSLRGWLGDVLRQNSAQAHQKGLEILWDVAADVPDAVCGDRDHLQQILVNLVGNAVKFTDRGSVKVEVGLNLAGEEAVVLEFRVIDTGPGIPPHLFDTIFERFSQGDESLTRQHGGVGLGLAICRELVIRLGGQIWVESELERGSTFRFTMPIKRTGPGLSDEARDLAGMRVLVVGPDPSAATLAMQLGRRGLVTAAVAAPGDVPGRLGGSPEVVLLFGGAPGSENLSMVESLRDHASTKDAGLILLGPIHPTAYPVEDGDAEPDLCLTRPVDPRTLLGALRTLRRRQPGHGRVDAGNGTDAGTGLKVLVADDNSVNLKVARVLLEGMGHSVYTVTDGAKALEILEREPFDVVLMDVQMPIMDGLEATRLIRSELPAERQPRVIAVTAASGDKDRQKCLAAGMDDFLAKPIGVAQLRDILLQQSSVAHWSGGSTVRRPDASLDHHVLDEIREMEGEGAGPILADIVSSFREASRSAAAGFERSLDNEDFEGVRKAAHSLKGSSRQVGAMILGTLCSRLETAVKRNQIGDARELVPQIRSEVEVVITALGEVLKTKPG